jgi:hypothetical protein
MIFHFARLTSLRKILLIKAKVLRPDRSAFDIIYTWELDVIRTHGLDRKLDLTIELAPAEASKIAHGRLTRPHAVGMRRDRARAAAI